jgi:hypothetical protein
MIEVYTTSKAYADFECFLILGTSTSVQIQRTGCGCAWNVPKLGDLRFVTFLAHEFADTDAIH